MLDYAKQISISGKKQFMLHAKTYMQARKQQWELDMEQQTGSK